MNLKYNVFMVWQEWSELNRKNTISRWVVIKVFPKNTHDLRDFGDLAADLDDAGVVFDKNVKIILGMDYLLWHDRSVRTNNDAN